MPTDTNPPDASIRTFVLDLGDGTRCTAQVNIAAIAALPPEKLSEVLEMKWEGPRRDSHCFRYLLWVYEVWQIVADLTGKRIDFVLTNPQGRTIIVKFEPHKEPEFLFLPLP